MSSPIPRLRDYERYSEDVPSSGNRPSSREDIDNYFDHNPPAPHRLSGSYLSPSGSPRQSADYLPPGASQPNYSNVSYLSPNPGGGLPAFGGNGPRYLSPLAAADATETAGVGMRQSNYSEMSMIGLNNPVTSLNRKSTWLKKEQRHKTKNHRLFIWVCSTLTLIIILAIVLGVVLGTRGNKNSSTQNTSTNSTNNNGESNTSIAGVVPQGDDPSQFTKDPNLKQSFYGIAYTMMDALYPDCNQGLASTIEDIQLLSQLTTRIRLYGADCNQTALVLEAIKQTKVDMKIYAAIYIPVDDDTAYTRQKDEIEKAIRTYGVDNIEGISVGNEYMLNYVTLNGGEGSGVDGAVGLAASRNLRTHITETRQMMADLGHGDVPIGTADAGAYFNTDLLEAIDFGLSNIHAWFAPTTAAGATEWTNNFFEDQNVTPARAVANHPTMVIAETGWPTHSNGTATENSGAGPGGEASVANLQTFLDDFICAANRASTPYFMFEYSDVPWKDIRFGGVEGYWGMFDKNKRLKDLTLPDCSHP